MSLRDIEWGSLGKWKQKCKERERGWKRKREDSGWRVKGKVAVCVTVSKPQEQQRKAVNGSSPCLNRLWTVLQSTANHKSSWRLLWVRALTRCLPPDHGDDTGRVEWKRQKEKEGKKHKEMRSKGGVGQGEEKVGLQNYGFAFSSWWPWKPLLGEVRWSEYASSVLSFALFVCLVAVWQDFSCL